jgi:hypothetical protein
LKFGGSRIWFERDEGTTVVPLPLIEMRPLMIRAGMIFCKVVRKMTTFLFTDSTHVRHPYTKNAGTVRY